MREAAFDIGDLVYHSAQIGGPRGLIINARYFVKEDEYEYLLSIDFSNRYWVTEDELSPDRVIV